MPYNKYKEGNMPIYKNYINGKWVKSASGQTFPSKNPANGKVLGKFQKSNKSDVQQAIVAAGAAFPEWRDTPAPTRAKYLKFGSTVERSSRYFE